MYKKLLLASGLALAVSVSTEATAFQPYIEGQLGFGSVADVDTSEYSGTSGGYTFTNFKGTVSYDEALAYGVEAGVQDVGLGNVRLGLGYTRFKAKAESLTVNGSLTDGTTTWTGPSTTSDSSLMKQLDNNVNLYTVNAYYDFDLSSKFIPYVGVGAGIADIENAKDKEAAFSFSAGVNYDLTEKVYMGVKGNYYLVQGPKDNLNVEFDTIRAYSFLATVGYRF